MTSSIDPLASPAPWYADLMALRGLGATAGRPGSLAGLHEARAQHLGQFFTSPDLVRVCWQLIAAPLRSALAANGSAALFDNSVGSGRMFMYADPQQHRLYGCDVHGETVHALAAAATAAGFTHDFEIAGLESIQANGMDFALINPPFSLNLQSPTLEALPSTTFGRYGPHTGALSHAYALDQALEAAQIVVAVLPAGYAEERAAQREPRLAAHIRLPGGLFRDENTDVRVSLLVYDSRAVAAPQELSAASLSAVPAVHLHWLPHRQPSRVRSLLVDDTGPAITRAVTGDRRVRIAHDGRRIKVGFACGLTEAKVLNAVYGDRIAAVAPENWRYPRGLKYSGAYALDLEAHIATGDPVASIGALIQRIRSAGAEVECAAGLMNHVRRRHRRSQRQATPLRHTIWAPEGVQRGASTLTGTARTTQPVDPSQWLSPVIKAGTEVAFKSTPDGVEFEWQNKTYALPLDEARKRFELRIPESHPGWVTVHEGMQMAYPELARLASLQVERSGVTGWLTWDYQQADLVEALLKPVGVVTAWEMGLGKARFAAAYILASGVKSGLIATEAYLVAEMVREFAALKLPTELWQVIDEPAKLDTLKRINLISYSRLRMPVPRRDGSGLESTHHTYAKRLRRRVAIVIADEGDCMAHMGSDRTRALWTISPKHRINMTGTPMGNYPRNVHPLLAWVGGDGTAAQPWGYYHQRMTPDLAKTAALAERGIDAYRDRFVTLEWVTRQWMEDNATGAKREIPRIQNLAEYRASLAPHVKRRLAKEPDVAAFVKIPDPTRSVHTIEWDEPHLAHYLTVAEEFAEWFQRARNDGRTSNLIALLARIGAVEIALNAPHRGTKFGKYNPTTAKDRFAVDHVLKQVQEGHRTLLFAHHPETVTRLGRLLEARGVETVMVHGGLSIKQRDRDITERFREGTAPVLLATYGCLQAGVNLWMSDRVVAYDRDWRAKVEEQAIRRTLRPQQQRPVHVDYLHLRASLDEYQSQMVAFKRDAANAGLDWATPETEDMEFLHLDSILNDFCKGLAELKGVERHELRKVLKAA